MIHLKIVESSVLNGENGNGVKWEDTISWGSWGKGISIYWGNNRRKGDVKGNTPPGPVVKIYEYLCRSQKQNVQWEFSAGTNECI